MEGLINFVIILIIIFAVLTRLKKASKDLQKKGQTPVLPANLIVPAGIFSTVPSLGLNSGHLDKIVKVYGVGAMLSTDEVSILLNVSQQTAQKYLDQLANTGKAMMVTTASGKIRYKLT